MNGDRNHTIEAPASPHCMSAWERRVEKRLAHRRERRTAKQVARAAMQ